METDVSSLKRILTMYKEEGDGDAKRSAGGGLMTRDLLGSSTMIPNRDELELDLHLKVPCKWEKRLDLVENKKNKIEDSCLVPKSNLHEDLSAAKTDGVKFQDLNLRPPNLELKLFPPTPPPPPSSSSSSSPPSTASFHQHDNNQSSGGSSVCTLDKVKSALERAGRKNPRSKMGSSTSPTSSSTNNKAAVSEEDDESKSLVEEDIIEASVTAVTTTATTTATLVAAGCPSCLSYVLISKHNPTCPRCFSDIPPPKKARVRIDLNSNANKQQH